MLPYIYIRVYIYKYKIHKIYIIFYATLWVFIFQENNCIRDWAIELSPKSLQTHR